MTYDWTKERVAFALDQWNGGRSASDIAAALPENPSRSAVLGKLNRLGALKSSSGRVVTRSNRKIKVVAGKVRCGAKSVTGINGFKRVALKDEALPADPPPPPVKPKMLSLSDLENHHCRFPFGTGPYHFCGHDAVPGQSYCEHHYRIVWKPIPPRKVKAQDETVLRMAAARKVIFEGVE